MFRSPRPIRVDLAGILVLAFALLSAASPRTAAARDGAASSARVVLPGARVVQPGQWIDLRWAVIDSVSELEVLLSVDGGRHFDQCVSPRLDPSCTHFLWRVPDAARSDLCLRIRFNRGGREIEAAPTTLVRVTRGEPDAPEPLGLPLGDEGTASGMPRPAGDRGATGETQTSFGPAEGADESLVPLAPVAARATTLLKSPARIAPFGAASQFEVSGRRPTRSTPLRP